MRFSTTACCVLAGVLLSFPSAQAGWLDTLGEQLEQAGVVKDKGATSSSGLSIAEMNGGLKEALSVGTKAAIEQLGKEDGFFGNALVKIPLPEKVRMMESGLRKIGMGNYADDFLLALNRAAEKAVPETAAIFADAITQMNVEDAKKILSGPDDAATGYFRSKAGPALQTAMLPIVKEYTQQTEVTKYYKTMVSAYDEYAAPMVKSSGLGSLMNSINGGDSAKTTDYDARDLDGYITGKSLNGLFSVLAQEEKKIRTNPAARSTELLEKVFGEF